MPVFSLGCDLDQVAGRPSKDRSTLRKERSPLRVNRSALRIERSAQRVNRAALRINRAPLRINRSPLRIDRAALRIDRSALLVNCATRALPEPETRVTLLRKSPVPPVEGRWQPWKSPRPPVAERASAAHGPVAQLRSYLFGRRNSAWIESSGRHLRFFWFRPSHQVHAIYKQSWSAIGRPHV